MQHIETVTVGSGGAASITFSAIPDTFTDLVILVSARTTRAETNEQIFFRLNASTTNATSRELLGLGSAVATISEPFIAGYVSAASATADTFGNVVTYIPNYRSSVAKSLSIDSVSENNATQAIQSISAGLWNNTAAVTSIELVARFGNNFVQHSTASLYGITAGSDGIVSVS